jgi:predicted transcriptional regulator
VSKRSRFELFGDILEAIQEDISKNGSARLTRVHGKVNVPYDRFKTYIEDLKQAGMIELSDKEGYQEIRLTERAFTYLAEYTRVKNFMIAFGLDRVRKDVSYGSISAT